MALRSEAGLLAPGLPVAAPSREGLSGLLRLAYPVTVAGPRRTCTGFPSPPTFNAEEHIPA